MKIVYIFIMILLFAWTMSADNISGQSPGSYQPVRNESISSSYRLTDQNFRKPETQMSSPGYNLSLRHNEENKSTSEHYSMIDSTVEVPLGSPPTPPKPTNKSKLGDVKGDSEINIIDALMIAQYYVNLPVEGFIKEMADVNDDNLITIVDALIIARYYVGIITELPPV